MTVNFPGGAPIASVPLGGRKAEVPAVKISSDQALPELKTQVVDTVEISAAEQKRFEAVKRAAESVFNNFYAVSDTKFSIYKDASGQYITRFTSLRDGSVTYIPEPDLLQSIERLRRNSEAIVRLEA